MAAAILVGWLGMLAGAFIFILGVARSRWGVPLLLVPLLAETVVLALGLGVIVFGLPVAALVAGITP